MKKGICDKLICPSRLYMYYVAKFFILRSTAAALHAAGYHDTNDALNAYKLWTSSPLERREAVKLIFFFPAKLQGKTSHKTHFASRLYCYKNPFTFLGKLENSRV